MAIDWRATAGACKNRTGIADRVDERQRRALSVLLWASLKIGVCAAMGGLDRFGVREGCLAVRPVVHSRWMRPIDRAAAATASPEGALDPERVELVKVPHHGGTSRNHERPLATVRAGPGLAARRQGQTRPEGLGLPAERLKWRRRTLAPRGASHTAEGKGDWILLPAAGRSPGEADAIGPAAIARARMVEQRRFT